MALQEPALKFAQASEYAYLLILVNNKPDFTPIITVPTTLFLIGNVLSNAITAFDILLKATFWLNPVVDLFVAFTSFLFAQKSRNVRRRPVIEEQGEENISENPGKAALHRSKEFNPNINTDIKEPINAALYLEAVFDYSRRAVLQWRQHCCFQSASAGCCSPDSEEAAFPMSLY